MVKTMDRKPDVLVVDDDDKFRSFVHEALEDAGLTVHEGKNGKEALDAFTNSTFDLMLLDFKLPDMNGLDVLKSVREKSPSTDVMVVTGFKDIDLAVDLLKLGAKEYVTKPIEPSELVRRIRTAVRARTAERRLRQLQLDFSSRLYYDLRSPLHTILSTLEYLEKDTASAFSDRQKVLMESMRTNLHGMTSILNDLIDITLLESGTIEIEKLPTNLDDLLPGIVERFRPKAAAKKLSLSCSAGKNIPTVPVDAERIKQVFNNLLDNAVKYTDKGEINVHLSVRKPNGSSDEFVEVTVSDSGAGIPREELPLVFDKYKDMLTGKSSSKRTTGLGLAICRSIVEAHHGMLTVDSVAGKGSEFKVLLPLEAL
ncbi:MAG TPA: response regulator [Bacteroidota bacterium]|jgi:signal transduction histidine kinase|nr:response regulator [Bacteroidota bacterium]